MCPTGLRLTSYSKRTCGRAHSNSLSCSSTTFSVGGSQYSRMCSRALGYRFGMNAAFYGYNDNGQSIDNGYVDGLSLTHGAPGSRKHIWTFAGGGHTGTGSRPKLQCPCDNGNTYPSPPFVGNDFFVRVYDLSSLVVGKKSSIQLLHSGMAGFVRVVVHATSSTIHNGSPRT